MNFESPISVIASFCGHFSCATFPLRCFHSACEFHLHRCAHKYNLFLKSTFFYMLTALEWMWVEHTSSKQNMGMWADDACDTIFNPSKAGKVAHTLCWVALIRRFNGSFPCLLVMLCANVNPLLFFSLLAMGSKAWGLRDRSFHLTCSSPTPLW